MTYREKYQKDYPTMDASVVHHFHCPKNPNTGGIMDCVLIRGSLACRACWDREIEEVTEDGKETLPR